MRLLWSLLALGTLTLAMPARLDAQSSTFRSGVDVVPLTVTVTDAAGNLRTGLTEHDFAVFEDGVPQTVSFFASDEVPVDVALVVDTSGSMNIALPLVKAAARGLVRTLRSGDRGTIVDVKRAIRFPVLLSDDLVAVEAAIEGLAASGSTALYDGVYMALQEFDRDRRRRPSVRRQVLVLLSDGRDNVSHITFEATQDLARRAGVTIYTIALNTELVPSGRHKPREATEAMYALRALATEAGGRVFTPAAARELPAVYDAIAREVASQYQVGYVATRPVGDGGFRQVAVRVLAPVSGVARTRRGYVADAPAVSPSSAGLRD